MEDLANQVKEARKRDDLLLVACSKGLKRDVEQLISEGASPTARDKSGASALHFAAFGGFLNICQLLVNKGAEVECEDSKGRTPLHLAAMKDQPQVISWLLCKGAWIDAYDSADDTPLHYASMFASVTTVTTLLQAGAKSSVANKMGLSPLAAALLRTRMDVVDALEGRESSSSERPHGFPLLHLAAAVGSVQAISHLIAKGVNVNDYSDSGLTPLHCAAAEGQLRAAELLLKHGADACLTSPDDSLAVNMIPLTDSKANSMDLETLRVLLTKAAGSGKPKPHKLPYSASTPSHSTNSFAELSKQSQISKIEAWASWSEEKLMENQDLNEEVVKWVMNVKRAKEALDLHACLLELHRDPDFQMDAKVPRVLKAIEAIRLDPSKLRDFKDDPVIPAVVGKLKRMQDVMRGQGKTQPINLSDLVLKDSHQLMETKQRHDVIRSRFSDACLAAIAAACCVTVDESRRAVGLALRKQDNMLPSEVANTLTEDNGSIQSAADVRSQQLGEPSASQLGTKKQMLKQFLQTVAIALFSYVVALFVSKRMATQLEDAAITPQQDFGDPRAQDAPFDEL